MKKVQIGKLKKKHIVRALMAVAILAVAGFLGWNAWDTRKDISDISGRVNELTSNYESTYATDNENSGGINFEVLNQYVDSVEVQDPEQSYKDGSDIVYEEKDVKVVELQITNNDEWVYSSNYWSIGTLNESGVIKRSITDSINPSKSKNDQSGSGYGLELAPGGKGTVYVYFADDGSEITRLFDIDNSKEITL